MIFTWGLSWIQAVIRSPRSWRSRAFVTEKTLTKLILFSIERPLRRSFDISPCPRTSTDFPA
jgi:hypothetical protein